MSPFEQRSAETTAHRDLCGGRSDSASCARFVDLPALVAPALRDPAVPPPGQWSVYDALSGRKELFTLTAGHVQYPEESAERARFEAANLEFLAP